jgi:hypothetical protein
MEKSLLLLWFGSVASFETLIDGDSKEPRHLHSGDQGLAEKEQRSSKEEE